MNEDSKNNEFKCPSWLLTGTISWSNLIDGIAERTKLDRDKVTEVLRLTFEAVEKMLRKGSSVNLPFGTFRSHFAEPDPITGELEMKVELIPSPKILKAIARAQQNRLNRISLN
jgi:hypothetical protein